jgi:hypothetical protein
MRFNLIFALFAMFSLFACQKDNYDEVAEETLPHDPTEVLQHEIGITYRLNGKQVVYDKGFSMVTQDSNNLDLVHYLLVGGNLINCRIDPEGNVPVFTTTIDDIFIDFTINTSTGALTSNFEFVKTELNGDSVFVQGPSSFNLHCGGNIPLDIHIEEENEDFIKGTYEGEFFYLPDYSYDKKVDCEGGDIESVGTLKGAFYLPRLGRCK